VASSESVAGPSNLAALPFHPKSLLILVAISSSLVILGDQGLRTDANVSFETEEEDRRETLQSDHVNAAELVMAEHAKILRDTIGLD
jgi:hypothetical protein